MRIIFAGTPDFAAGNLQALIDAGITPVAVFSQPDRPKGRGKKLVATPVKAVAERYDIPVFQPLNFKEQSDIEQLAALDADLMIVVAYGLLLPKALLETPTLGCINVHASVLPRWRGAAPIERAIEAGDTETGVTIMQMDEGLDTGDMLLIRKCAIDDQTTGDSLRQTLLAIGSEALIDVVKQLQAGQASATVQNDDDANYAKKLSKQEAQIDWTQSAKGILRKVHAFNSANACYSFFNGERVKFFQLQIANTAEKLEPGSIAVINKKTIEIACGDGTERLSVKEMQLSNAKRMATAAVLNGKKDYFAAGEQFKFQT